MLKIEKDIFQLSDLLNEMSIKDRNSIKILMQIWSIDLVFRKFYPKKYILFPSIEKKFIKDWTNKSCESLNQILKQLLNWKFLWIADLIERLHEIIKLKEDFKRAV